MLGKKEEENGSLPPPPGEMQQVRTKKMEEKKKKKQIQIRESPRSPLNGLNGSSTSSSSSSSSSVSSSISSERLNRSRKGCFSFGSSHSPAAATKPRTPTTAGKKVSAKPLDRTGLKNPSKLVGDRPRKQMGQAKKSQKDTVTKLGSSTRWVFRKNGRGVDGGCDGAVSTVITPSIPQSTPEKEGETKKKSSITPTDTTTPPIHASISPEIVGGGATSLALPICFAAGHLISGIPDGRKKCKPRGILKVRVDEQLGFRDSGESLATPSPVRASMQWISSPNRLEGFGCTTTTSGSDTIPVVDFTREASVDWLLPLPEHRTPRLETCSPSNGSCSWRLSPTATSTPSHRVPICRTPTSDSSISPFSMILKNAATTVSANSWGIDNNSQFSSPSNIPNGDCDDGDYVILTSGSPSASKNPRNSHDTNFKFDCATTASKSIDLSHFHKNTATTSTASKASRMIESNRHEEEEEDQETKHDQSGFGSIELLYPDESATSSGDLDGLREQIPRWCCYKDDEETSDDGNLR